MELFMTKNSHYWTVIVTGDTNCCMDSTLDKPSLIVSNLNVSLAEFINLEQSHKYSPTEENDDKLNAVRTKLNLILPEHVKKNLLFLYKQCYHKYGNKPSKLLVYQLKKELADWMLKCMHNTKGQCTINKIFFPPFLFSAVHTRKPLWLRCTVCVFRKFIPALNLRRE